MTLSACNTDKDDPLRVDVSANVETINVTVSPSTIAKGDEVTLSAPAHDMYRFSHWENVDTGETISTEATHQFTATGPLNIMAVYHCMKEIMAAETLASFSGDLSHLDDVMATMNASDALTIELGLHVAMLDDQVINEVGVTVVMRTATLQDRNITEYEVVIKGSDIPFDEVRFHVIIKETANFFEMFIDLGFVFDMMAQEEDLDVRTLFAFDNDYLHLHFPQALRDDIGALIGDAFDDLLNEMATPDFEVDEALIEAVLEKLEALSAYLSTDYLNDLEGVEVQASIQNQTEILTEMTLTSTAVQNFFTHIFEDLYDIALFLDEDGMLPSYEDFTGSNEYQEILDMLDEMPSFDVSFLHTPFDGEGLALTFHVLPFLRQFDDHGDLDDLQTLNVSLNLSAGTTLSDVQDAKNVYHILEEMFMIMMAEDALDLAESIDRNVSLADGTYDLTTLNDDHGIYIPTMPVLIDYDQSYIVISGGDMTIAFMYAFNDQAAFNRPVTLTELRALNLLESDFPETRQDLTNVHALFNRSNLNIYKVMVDVLAFLMEEGLHEPEATFPVDDWLEDTFGHIADMPGFNAHYVMVFAMDDETNYQMREYLVQDTVNTITQDLITAIHNHGYWTIDDTFIYGEDAYIYLFSAHRTAVISIETAYAYQNTSRIRYDVYSDASSAMPTGDMNAQPDLMDVPRYPDSILYMYDEDDAGFSIRTYLIENHPTLDVYAFYYDFIVHHPHWVLDDDYVERDHLSGYLSFDDGHRFGFIEFYESYTYHDVMTIEISFFE